MQFRRKPTKSVPGFINLCAFGVIETFVDQASSLGQPKTWWNYFRVTLGSGQGLLGALGELPGNSKNRSRRCLGS